MLVQTTDDVALDSLVPVLEYFIDRSCLQEWKINRQTIAFHNLSWLLAGSAIFWRDGVSYEAQAGDLVYLPRGTTRKAATDPENLMHCYACDFQCQSLGGTASARLPLPTLSHIGIPDGLLELYRRLNRVWLEKSPGSGLETRGLFSLIIHRLVFASRAVGRHEEPAKRLSLVQDFIFQHYAEPISLARLAALVRLNPRYFGNWFSDRTGMTAKEYINRIRIRKATDLLATGGFNVAEAAYKSGFDDVFYFSKVFKRIAGYPPSDLLRFGSSGRSPIPD
jgi:AraC family transcriptional regulator, L-rhamnose operon regulatory protein RhaS